MRYRVYSTLYYNQTVSWITMSYLCDRWPSFSSEMITTKKSIFTAFIFIQRTLRALILFPCTFSTVSNKCAGFNEWIHEGKKKMKEPPDKTTLNIEIDRDVHHTKGRTRQWSILCVASKKKVNIINLHLWELSESKKRCLNALVTCLIFSLPHQQTQRKKIQLIFHVKFYPIICLGGSCSFFSTFR